MRVASFALLIVALISGCATTNHKTVEFRTTTDVHFKINGNEFDTVELQPSETLLWNRSELVGVISTIDTAHDFGTAVEEVRQGFMSVRKTSETARELELPDDLYGFSSSVSGYTTAFIAVEDNEESWITISVKDEFFAEILSSISIR